MSAFTPYESGRLRAPIHPPHLRTAGREGLVSPSPCLRTPSYYGVPPCRDNRRETLPDEGW